MEWSGPEKNKKKVIIISLTAVFILTLFLIMTRGRILDGEPVLESEEEYVYLSPYDELFREYADSSVCDWFFLAAIAYVESKFDTTSVSPNGARGLMQIMPATYEHLLNQMGEKDSTDYSTRMNVKAAAHYVAQLSEQFSFISDSERLNFVLASYNGGSGHIFDAMRIARKNGLNRYNWRDLTDVIRTMNQEEVYTDSVCRFGKFEGVETLLYVDRVQRKYKEYKRLDLIFRSADTLVNNLMGKE